MADFAYTPPNADTAYSRVRQGLAFDRMAARSGMPVSPASEALRSAKAGLSGRENVAGRTGSPDSPRYTDPDEAANYPGF